jgi:hypothetical protein
MEEVRLTLWLEEEMQRTLRIAEAGQVRDLRPLCQLHLPGQRPLRLRRRLGVLLRQAPFELHPGGRWEGGAPGGRSANRPGSTLRCPATRGPCAAATRSWRSWRAMDTSPRASRNAAKPSRSSWQRAVRSRPTLPARLRTSSKS